MDKEEVRLVLQNALETTFPELPVIFRPSGNFEYQYPCIVYEPKKEQPAFANNKPYVIGTQFEVMFLSYRPGFNSTRLMYDLGELGINVVNHNSYATTDVVHEVFTVKVHTL